MPQFHLNNFIPQLAWLALFFAILYFGIVRATLPKIGRTIAQREDQISDDLAIAEAVKLQADRMTADYAAGIDAAHKVARDAIAGAKAEAASNIEAAVAKSNVVIAERAASAEASLSSARIEALNQIEGIAADAGAHIVERLTGLRPAQAVVADAARAVLAG